jgi:adenylate cyclase
MNWTRLWGLLPLALLSLAIAIRVMDPTPIQRMRLVTFDEFQRRAPRAWTDAPVRIVDVDDASLERLGQWPWPRSRMAELVDRLRERGAAAVVFDVMFAEPDRTSPKQVLKVWQRLTNDPALAKLAPRLPDHDQVLAKAIGKIPTVLGFMLTSDSPPAHRPRVNWGIAVAGDDPRPFLSQFSGAIANLPELEATASGQGSFNSSVDVDGIIRHIPVMFRLLGNGTVSGEVYPSLAAEALRVVQGASSFVIKSSGASGNTAFGETTGLNKIRIGRITVPTDANGQIWLYDSGYVAERFIPAWKVMQPGTKGADVEGRIVLIGTSAAGLKDIRSTALNPVAAGVEIQAQALEQMILGEHLLRPDWTTGAELLWLVFIGGVLVILLPRWGAAWCALVAVGGVGLAVGVSWFAFVELHWLLDPVYPSAVAIGLYLIQSFILFLRTEAERRNVRGAFSRYLSLALVERVANDRSKLKLGGEIRDLTLMFCDIRGFTVISESLEAEALTSFINAFLTPMTDVILSHGGTIDKYMGDAIMAFWNAPLDDPDHAAHASRAVLEMVSRLDELNEEWRVAAEAAGEPHRRISIGIGLNSGDCCVGNMGSDQRFDYSVLGDVANISSRLEGQSKTYGVTIVAGEATMEKAPGLAWLEIDSIRLVGKEKPVRIYTLLGDEAVAESQWYRGVSLAQKNFLSAYRAAEIYTAVDNLESLIVASEGKLDGLTDLYERRLDDLEPELFESGWDGVYTAATK